MRPSADRRQAGFSLVEMLLTLLVSSILILGVLATFDFNGRVTRVQTHVADMQQSLRIAQQEMVRLVRMAGRGGLPAGDAVSAPFPTGLAVSIRDNVGANQLLVASKPETLIVQGTDVVTVRGVFSTPIYQLNATDTTAFTLDVPANPTRGTVKIFDKSPKGVPQDLQPFKDAINNRVPEALILVSTLDDTLYAVVKLTGGTINADNVVLDFQISGDSTHADRYRALSSGGAFPAGITSIAFAGILEEYAFYVRGDRAIDNDPASDLTPKLSRARFFPGTGLVYRGDDTNAWVDVADNIIDLQAALGFDSANGGRTTDDADDLGTDDQILESADGNADDWLFNGTGDDGNNAVWRNAPLPSLYYLRLSTLARTDRRDRDYQAPLLPARIENRPFTAGSPENSRTERMFRRRLLQTVIDLRNLA